MASQPPDDSGQPCDGESAHDAELLARADELADTFEDYEPHDADRIGA